MTASYKKPSLSPVAKPSGSTAPSVSALKTRVSYSKADLRADPMKYSSFGFGNTGLAQTPSIIGMAKGFK